MAVLLVVNEGFGDHPAHDVQFDVDGRRREAVLGPLRLEFLKLDGKDGAGHALAKNCVEVVQCNFNHGYDASFLTVERSRYQSAISVKVSFASGVISKIRPSRFCPSRLPQQ